MNPSSLSNKPPATMRPTGDMSILFRKVDLPLEAILLFIGAMALLVAGAALLLVAGGVLPFAENGLRGLLLVLFALQTMALGKTPVGDMPRSKAVTSAGVAIAGVGITACCIPSFTTLPHLLLLACFGLGGLIQLARLCLDPDKLRAWVRYGGIFRHLAQGCALAYSFSMLLAGLLWNHDLLPLPMTAATLLMFGAALLYLGGILRRIYAIHPEAAAPGTGDAGLSLERCMLLFMGVFMLLLGVLLIPVNLGLLPFSGSAQLGLLMVIFAVQTLASGNTPIGPFPRTRLTIALGYLFAAPGIVSCIVPDVLAPTLTILVGVLNISGGAAALTKTFIPAPWPSRHPREPVPPALAKIFGMQLAMHLLTIMFGASMLVPGLIPGLLIGLVLSANGVVLLCLLHALTGLERRRQIG